MLLELINVSKKYMLPSGKEEISVLQDITLQVAAGEAISMVGPSGSGKSTLLNIIGTLDRPSSGTVSFKGENLADLEDLELSRIRNQEIGFVFQLHHLLPHLTVLENVLIPTIPLGAGRDTEAVLNRAKRLLARVGMDKHMNHFPGQLSGGEMQRVAVIRALINQPQLVLADEPTGSLDKESSDRLSQILIELNQEEQTTLIVVTHSLELAQLMDKTYMLRRGKLEIGEHKKA
jgi:lipoprotein-releasing system ATP-binding protein